MLDISRGNLITKLCSDTKLPKMVRVRQNFDPSHIDPSEIPAVVREQLNRPEITEKIKPGMTIAVSSGSRGVANIALITKSVVSFLKELGAEPFVFPAMGSHGGATAEGQKEVLSAYGVTEEYVGCPIRATMDTVQVGVVADENNMPVFTDRYAHESDGIILIGRIKAHTAFRGPYESGLVKMSVIGMGKQHGAETVHESGFANMARLLPKVGKVVFDNNPILCGLGLIENAFDETYRILGMTPDEIWEKEPAYLLEAKKMMGQLLFDNLDVLVVDRIGKDISGDGMDPNVTGRYCVSYLPAEKRVQHIAVLDLSEASHGNCNGIGIADVTTMRFAKKINLDETYPNVVTSTVLDACKIPLIAHSDKTCIQTALRTCNYYDRQKPRIVRIQDTMNLEEIEISEGMLEEARKNSNVQILGGPHEWRFNSQGDLW